MKRSGRLPTRPAVAVLAVLLSMGAGACGRDRSGDVLAQDSTLARDLRIARRDSGAQPQLQDTMRQSSVPPSTQIASAPRPEPAPQREKPAPPVGSARSGVAHQSVQTTQPAHSHVIRSEPSLQSPRQPPRQNPSAINRVAQRPATPAVGAAVGSASGSTTVSRGTVAATAVPVRASTGPAVLPSGTVLALRAGQQVCTNTNTAGDRITASLTQPVGSAGATIPTGSTVVLEVTSLRRTGKTGAAGAIGLAPRSLAISGHTYPLSGTVTPGQVTRKRATLPDAEKVLGGAVVGAVIGDVAAGGNSRTTGAVVGAAGGAAAGAILANQTRSYNSCIPSGSPLNLRLDAPVTLPAGH